MQAFKLISPNAIRKISDAIISSLEQNYSTLDFQESEEWNNQIVREALMELTSEDMSDKIWNAISCGSDFGFINYNIILKLVLQHFDACNKDMQIIDLLDVSEFEKYFSL